MATLRLVLVCAILTCACLGQSATEKRAPLATVTVHFEGHSDGFWARYLVTTRNTRQPGWIVSESGEDSNEVGGIRPGAASRFRGILFAPGCALQAVDIAITEAKHYDYVFPCETVKQVEIQGIVIHPPRWSQPEVIVDAKYVATWAGNFFGYDDGTDTEIPLGSTAALDEQNRFRLSVPNLAKDKGGEIRIWLRDEASGRIRDQLRVSLQSPENQRTRLGGIPISALNSTPLLFYVCSANSPSGHDKYGFAVRDDTHVCEP